MHLLLALSTTVATQVVAQGAPTHISAVDCGAPTASSVPELSWHGDVVRWAEWSVSLGPGGDRTRVRSRVVVARFAPAAVRLTLDINRIGNTAAPWSIADAPSDALLAMNAGQFTDDGPWGWVVHKGRELQPPGVGYLAGAVVVDSTGRVHILAPPEIAAWRATPRVKEAVQTYPMLLMQAGVPPPALCNATGDVDATHRDTRLAIGIAQNGDVLVAMSRFEAPGGVVTRVPIGPTTPEMAEIMRRLGAERAIMLDGGLSAQMLVRSSTAGRANQRANNPDASRTIPADSARWPGLRNVPLALVVRAR